MSGLSRPIQKNVFWITAFSVIVAFALGWILHDRVPTGAYVPVDPPLREKQAEYAYINALLACGTWESKDFDEYAPFKKKVSSYIGSMVDAGKVQKVGVYFRELKGGHWFGVNENAQFSPASLMKVPIMIAYLKSAEKKPEMLQDKVFYDGAVDLNKDESFPSSYSISAHTTYTINDLLRAMIVSSDNNAMELLFNRINHDSLTEVFTDLGMTVPADNSPAVDFMSPKSFSYFFRILYNSTYLDNDFSEKALNLLTKSDFLQGLQASVPQGVAVAHKFGERTVLSQGGILQFRELHDCGIIYSPARPYLLCVMTKGQNFSNLESVIRNIGKMTYDEVNAGQ